MGKGDSLKGYTVTIGNREYNYCQTETSGVTYYVFMSDGIKLKFKRDELRFDDKTRKAEISNSPLKAMLDKSENAALIEFLLR